MKPIEREMIHGMTSLLNDAIEAYNLNKPIISDEQFDMRIKDLEELERETRYVLVNSPTQKIDINPFTIDATSNLNECNTIDEIAKFFHNEKLVASANPHGISVHLRYEDGVLVSVSVEEKCNLKQFKNVPYKIEEEKSFTIKGKAVKNEDRLYFYADRVLYGNNGIYDDLQELERLGFDIVPIWSATELNPKTLQSFIDFAYDYTETDEEIPCDGIVFRYDNFNNKPLRYEGIIYKK